MDEINLNDWIISEPFESVPQAIFPHYRLTHRFDHKSYSIYSTDRIVVLDIVAGKSINGKNRDRILAILNLWRKLKEISE